MVGKKNLKIGIFDRRRLTDYFLWRALAHPKVSRSFLRKVVWAFAKSLGLQQGVAIQSHTKWFWSWKVHEVKEENRAIPMSNGLLHGSCQAAGGPTGEEQDPHEEAGCSGRAEGRSGIIFPVLSAGDRWKGSCADQKRVDETPKLKSQEDASAGLAHCCRPCQAPRMAYGEGRKGNAQRHT